MRPLRTLSLAVTVAIAAALILPGNGSARAQSTEEAERRAEEAAERADVAAGLVDTAVAERVEIELQLAASITRLNDLAAELSRISATVDRLSAQIGYTDAELSGIQAELEIQAIDAYMTALTMPGAAFVNSDSVEQALVAGQMVDDVINSGREQVGQLVLKRDSLEELLEELSRQRDEVARLRAEMDAETERLTELYASADAAVAEAIAEANAADAARREALDAVAAARAREEERRRQEERPPTITAPPPADPGTPTTTVATPTTVDGGGGERDWRFPPAVERWRSQVQQYFPSSRIDEALAIIQCESLGDPEAYNPYSGSGGLFQFLPSTWASTSSKAGFPGASVFEPGPNIGSAAWLAARYQDLGLGYWQAWSCRRVLG